ncbi:hypothetical protein FGM00_01480 [Aggregatimonas sangjinii]|uniref:DUF4890 domain-containing protein n=1 Tax=Aggregatimonas sangjinii TaxID=2583587 RepID=A0A5B7SQE3_9FLAO|nr:hypothetical protein [Aggregatimonas sangjinii]QCW98853.1 hypothetical protein FGM00_01480 [Aggregatimonas sangjinii]
MKKVLIIAMAFISLHTVAQEREKGERSEYTPEQMATLHTKRMTLALDLSAAQQEQVQNLNLSQAEMRKTQMEARKARKTSEEGAKPTADERYAMQTERLDQQIALKAEMKKILSDEQYARWEKMAKRKGKHKKGKRGGKKGKHMSRE